jgi:Fur family peroxide stress response transcriptional regulator
VKAAIACAIIASEVDKIRADGNYSHVRIIRNKNFSRNKPEVDRWCASFIDLCRERGVRVTAQRLAVYRALAEDLSHPTADALYSKLRQEVPGMSQATVYRTLESLEKEGLIRRVSAPEAKGRFDANVENHQHLVCRACGSFSDVTLPAYSKGKVPAVTGFTIEEVDVRLVGLCKSCADSGAHK